MNRRDTLLAVLALSPAPFAVRAQGAPKVDRISFFSINTPPRKRLVVLSDALREPDAPGCARTPYVLRANLNCRLIGSPSTC